MLRQPRFPHSIAAAILLSGAIALADEVKTSAAMLGIRFVEGSSSKLIVDRNGRSYTVDLVSKRITESGGAQAGSQEKTGGSADGAAIFRENCARCHGADGKGNSSQGTPDFTNPKTLASLSDEEVIKTIEQGRKGTKMPAWSGKLTDAQIRSVAEYVRSLGSGHGSGQLGTSPAEGAGTSKVYTAGDDVLVTLPTGRRLDRHGVYVNFTHRFAFDPAFSGEARGGALLGLDGFALASFGFGYGVTKKLSVDVFRSPTFIGRPIQLMAAYNVWDEHDGKPLNIAGRFSVQGLNDFSREFTESFEAIVSRSITARAQIYAVPTFSVANRRLLQPVSYRSEDIPAVAGLNSFALGVGLSIDIRPTVALLAEIDPTLVNFRELGIHRPAYAFGIQKKIRRHAFTLGLTNAPGSTVAQRSGTRASFLNDPNADTPSGLFLGFDLTRQIH